MNKIQTSQNGLYFIIKYATFCNSDVNKPAVQENLEDDKH
jgi:hypothetical protein